MESVISQFFYQLLIVFFFISSRCFSSDFSVEDDLSKTYNGEFTASFLHVSGDTHKTIIEKGGVFPRLSSKHVRYGENSVLVEVSSLKNGVSSSSYIKNRSEIHIENFVFLQKDHWIQFSVFFAKNFSTPDNWFLFFQAWQKNAGNPILSMSIDQMGKLSIAARNDHYHKGKPLVLYKGSHKVIKGVWHDFVIYLKGSLKQEGALFVWQRTNGDQACFVPLIERQGLNIGKSVYRNRELIKKSNLYISPRVGIYRGGSGLLHQLWFDGLKYGKSAPLKGFNICDKQE